MLSTQILSESVIERNPEFVVTVNYGDVTADLKTAFMKNNPASRTSMPSRTTASSCWSTQRSRRAPATPKPSSVSPTL